MPSKRLRRSSHPELKAIFKLRRRLLELQWKDAIGASQRTDTWPILMDRLQECRAGFPTEDLGFLLKKDLLSSETHIQAIRSHQSPRQVLLLRHLLRIDPISVSRTCDLKIASLRAPGRACGYCMAVWFLVTAVKERLRVAPYAAKQSEPDGLRPAFEGAQETRGKIKDSPRTPPAGPGLRRARGGVGRP